MTADYPNLQFRDVLALRPAIVRAYARMPVAIRRERVTFVLKTRADLNGHRGYYKWQLREIWITGAAKLKTAIHELGHHYHRTILTDPERARWLRFWQAHQREMPTSYARTEASEGFAECWEFRWYKPGFPERLFRATLKASVRRELDTYQGE